MLYRQQLAAWQPLSWWLAQPEYRDVPPAETSTVRDRFAAALSRDLAGLDQHLAAIMQARADATLRR